MSQTIVNNMTLCQKNSDIQSKQNIQEKLILSSFQNIVVMHLHLLHLFIQKYVKIPATGQAVYYMVVNKIESLPP